MRERVLHEVGEDATQQRLVGREDRRFVRRLVGHGGALGGEPGVPVDEQFRQECRRGDGLGRNGDARLLDARHLEQVLDEPQQVLGLPLGFRHRLVLALDHRSVVALAQHLQRRQHAGERRLEVVDDHLHQVVAHLGEFAQLAIAVLERVGGALELEERAHAGAEHQPVVRLEQEVVAAGLDALHPVGRVVERGDEDDGDARRARVALDAAAHFEAGIAVGDPEVAGRHRDVENAEVGMVLEAGGHRPGAVVGSDRAKPEQGQLVGQQLDVGVDVVGDEDERGELRAGARHRSRAGR